MRSRYIYIREAFSSGIVEYFNGVGGYSVGHGVFTVVRTKFRLWKFFKGDILSWGSQSLYFILFRIKNYLYNIV